MSDLDERLVRYARHLDEHMDRFEVRRGLAPVDELGPEAAPLVASDPVASRPVLHGLWLATAAAVCLLVVGSLAWWRTASSDPVDVTDSTAVTVDPSPDDPVVADSVPGEPDSDPLRWREVEASGGFSAPVAATAFKGGVLAVSGDGLFVPMSWWAPDGQRFEDQVSMEEGPGAPRALAADDEVAVAVGDGGGTAKSWVTADGQAWEVHALLDASSVRSLAHTPLGFVVVGSSQRSLDGDLLHWSIPAAWSSADGREWTRLAIPDAVPGEVTDVAASPVEILVVGYVEGAPYAAAADAGGGEWRPVPVDRVPSLYIGGGPTGVAWTGEHFLAVGDYGGAPMLWQPTAGGSLAPVPTLGVLGAHPVSIVGFTDIAAADDTVAVVVKIGEGEHGMATTVWASTAGGDWRPAAPIDVLPVPITSISSGDGELVGIAADGGVWVGTPT
jgi:hypothetical protein